MAPIDRAQIFETVREALESIVGRELKGLSEATRANEVAGWDSLAHLKLLVALEEKYDLVFGDYDLESPQNLGEFLTLVQAKRAAAAALDQA